MSKRRDSIKTKRFIDRLSRAEGSLWRLRTERRWKVQAQNTTHKHTTQTPHTNTTHINTPHKPQTHYRISCEDSKVSMSLVLAQQFLTSTRCINTNTFTHIIHLLVTNQANNSSTYTQTNTMHNMQSRRLRSGGVRAESLQEVTGQLYRWSANRREL